MTMLAEEKPRDKELDEIVWQKTIAQAVFPFQEAKIFKFKATNRDGRETSGFVRSKSRETAIKGLLESGYTVHLVEETTIEATRTAPIILNPMAIQEAVAIFTRQLLVLYHSGIPLDRAVSILFVQTEETHLKQALSAIYVDMVRGKSFKKAIARHPHVFSQDYIEMIEAGERSGELERVLEHIADLLEKNIATIKKMSAALTYPFLVMGFTLLVNYAVFKWVLPNFVTIFKDMNVELPLLTRLIVAIVEFMQTPWFWVVTVAGIMSLGIIISWATTQLHIRRIIDEVLLKIPVINKIIKEVIFIRCFRVFATMVSSGVTVCNAIKSVSRVAANQAYMDAFDRMFINVQKGKDLPECFDKEKHLFPLIVRQMMHVGDETGELDIVLNLLADFYEAELDFVLNSVSVYIEPLLVGFMGVVVGIVVMAIFIPIYNMITSLS